MSSKNVFFCLILPFLSNDHLRHLRCAAQPADRPAVVLPLRQHLRGAGGTEDGELVAREALQSQPTEASGRGRDGGGRNADDDNGGKRPRTEDGCDLSDRSGICDIDVVFIVLYYCLL